MLSATAVAADLTVRVVDQKGQAVSNAVVTLVPLDNQAAAPAPMTGQQIAQRNMQFDPDLLIVPVGGNVTFPNTDTTGHHVYSFSPAKSFNIRIIAQGKSASVNFDKVGIVTIGCNIHDGMVGFIHVVETKWSVITSHDEEIILHDVPDGRYRLSVWHEDQTSAKNTHSQKIEFGAVRTTQTISLRLRTSRRNQTRY